MITVHDHLHNYCNQRQLPPPSKEDIIQCGKLIRHHFKYYWGKNQEEGKLIGFGFTVKKDGEKNIVVMHYPESFTQEMDTRIDVFYKNKNNRISIPSPAPDPPPSTVKKRKRIPVSTPIKERSAKPSSLGHIQGLS